MHVSTVFTNSHLTTSDLSLYNNMSIWLTNMTHSHLIWRSFIANWNNNFISIPEWFQLTKLRFANWICRITTCSFIGKRYNSPPSDHTPYISNEKCYLCKLPYTYVCLPYQFLPAARKARRNYFCFHFEQIAPPINYIEATAKCEKYTSNELT